MTQPTDGIPVHFEVVGRPNAVSLTYMRAVPRVTDAIRFGEQAKLYLVTAVLWTPNETEAHARVKLVGIETDR